MIRTAHILAAAPIAGCFVLAGPHPEALAQHPGSACPAMIDGTYTLASTPKQKIPLLRSKSGTAAIMIAAIRDSEGDGDFNVNSDGSPRAYHLLDPEGRTFALNDMYSGGVRVWDRDQEVRFDKKGLSTEERVALRKRYYQVFAKVVQEKKEFGAKPSKYEPRKDAQYTTGGAYADGLDEPTDITERVIAWLDTLSERQRTRSSADLADYNCVASKSGRICFRKGIITFSKGEPCVREKGRYAGFLVNETSLDGEAGNAPDPENAEDAKCGKPVNLDAEKLPGLVLPGGQLAPDEAPTLKAGNGDVVIGYNPANRKWVFAVVSDGGPKTKFGEASIAFNRVLGIGYDSWKKAERPRNYRGDLLTRAFQPKRPIVVLLLPASKKLLAMSGEKSGKFDFSPEAVARVARQAFLDWAKAKDLTGARKMFRDCHSALKSQK